MTEQKTTTTRKRTPRTKVQPVETIETTIIKEEVEQHNVKVPQKRELTDSTKVTIMNNTMGVYGYRNGNKALSLSSYGDIAKLPFEEIQAMYSNPDNKRHIEDAFILILDEDAVEELNLQHLYKNVLLPKGVDEILRNPSQLQNLLPQMPPSMKETVIIHARQGFKSLDANKRLTDISIVQAIQNATGIDILE